MRSPPSCSSYFGGQVIAADLDGDGDLDLLVVASGDDDLVLWYENLVINATPSPTSSSSSTPTADGERGGI